MQHLMGIEGLMVDHVEEITEAVREMMKPSNRDAHDTKPKPNFSKRELSFRLKLIPEDLQESKRQKREKREGGRISSGFVKADLEGQTDPDRADILWEASSVMKLVVTVLQQCCLECLVNPTVRSSLIELKFGRGVVDWFILDLYGGISLWLPESL
ncbi:hypothetical protein F2Q68_00000755 [Brassica cretica]|uniref:Uncharacterized protein n=1 Tax=Brassica cretica TaxID=69181 RepID=A0A8S9JCE9_BRACR|nr:hypothetical protein F2Q68_00000755 [Brassica cretica]